MYGLYGRDGQFSINFVDLVDWNYPYGRGGRKPENLLKSRSAVRVRPGVFQSSSVDLERFLARIRVDIRGKLDFVEK